MSQVPAGTTHLEFHADGARLWKIPPAEHSDGTGDFWRDGGWVTSEISDKFFATLAPIGTPSHRWSEDPHAGHYDGERAQLALGHLTDDELANGAFLNYDMPFDIARALHDSDYHLPIAWMTAVKDRLRWLSRSLDKAQAELSVWQRPEPWGANDIIPLGEGSITGEAYRRGVEAGRAVYLPPRMTEEREIQELLGRFGVYGAVPTGVATQIYNAALDHVSELNSKLADLPLRLVADVTGGAIHAVYAELPTEVIFISEDSDDVAALAERLSDSEMYRNPEGKAVAAWEEESRGGVDAEMVEHYFTQRAS